MLQKKPVKEKKCSIFYMVVNEYLNYYFFFLRFQMNGCIGTLPGRLLNTIVISDML